MVWGVVFPEGEEGADVLLQDDDCLALLGVVLALGLLLLGLVEEGALSIGIEQSEIGHGASIYYSRSGFLGADKEHLIVDVEGDVAIELEQILKGLHEAALVVILQLLANL